MEQTLVRRFSAVNHRPVAVSSIFARFYNKFFRVVREFGAGVRVIRCKAKSGEAPTSRGSKDATNQKPPVASTATAVEKNSEGDTKMKKTAYTMIALLVLVGSMAVAAQAQNNGRNRLTASIPFEFNVGDKTMPAGKYTVSQINPSSDRVALRLRNQDGSATAILQMNAVIGEAPETAKLVFRRYGSQHFFAEAWIDGDSTGLQAPRSRAERVALRQLAGTQRTTTTVALKSR